MSPITIGLISFVILFALLVIGLPIGFGMFIVGFAGFCYLMSPSAAIAKIATVPFEVASSYDLGTLPLFLLMANIVFASGLGQDFYNLAARWIGRLRGGLAMATIAGCAGFAAVSASSLATAVTMSLVASPEMKKYKYDPALITGSIAAGGGLGILIPPSGVLIIYGIITECSIGKLFIAGIIPGIIQAVFFICAVYIICLIRPNYGPQGPAYSFKEKIAALGKCGEIVALIVIVLGGLIVGWFTPTEAGAVGAFGAIILSLIRRRLNLSKFRQAILDTVRTTGMLYLIMIGAFMFQYFVAVTTIPFVLADFVTGLAVPPMATMLLIIVVYIVLGCFLEAMSMILLTVPIFFPLVQSLGFDLLWFGVLIVIVVELALITPPMGMTVYAVSGLQPDVPLTVIFKSVIPFIIASIFLVILLLFVPSLALFLPGMM